LTNFYLRHSDGFILLSESNKKELEELRPGAKYIIHSLPFHDHYTPRIPEKEAREKLGLPQDKKILIYFGFIRDYKGLDLLIESMKYLDDSYLLMIVGEVYGEFTKYQQQIDSLDLNSRIVKYINYIPDTEIPTYFSAADVCVLTYRSATQSGIVGISYQFDVPVIVTDVGGFKELVDENKTALVVKNLDPKEISEAVRKYFAEGLKEKFIPGIAAVRQKHSWDGLAQDVIKLYQSL
jgi:glycosyltransferase involved in cell wall biosynthesis